MGFHSTGAYFGGRAYITSILKNQSRAYFQVRSYFQGKRVLKSMGLFLSHCLPSYFFNNSLGKIQKDACRKDGETLQAMQPSPCTETGAIVCTGS